MRRTTTGILPLFLFLLLLSGGARETLATVGETFSWHGKPAEALRIDLRRGDLVVRPSTSGRIEVSAVKRGRATEAAAVRIEVEEGGPVTRIGVVHPRRAHRDDLEPKVGVDFEIGLPRGVRFVGTTEVGDIDADGLAAPVEATSVVGDIHIRTDSYAAARTTNGRIVASIGRADWEGTLTFRTTNGDIRLRIPAEVDLELSATSINGDFETNLFPLERRALPGTRVRGTLGRGGRKLELGSVNGNLKVLRRDE